MSGSILVVDDELDVADFFGSGFVVRPDCGFKAVRVS